MASKLEVYKCTHCGQVVEILTPANTPLHCCGTKMEKLEEQYVDPATNKHVPLVEKVENGYKVTVGSTLHPMSEEHYIEWIELVVGTDIYRKHLSPRSEPVAFFAIQPDATPYARSYCNLHNLWKSES